MWLSNANAKCTDKIHLAGHGKSSPRELHRPDRDCLAASSPSGLRVGIDEMNDGYSAAVLRYNSKSVI